MGTRIVTSAWSNKGRALKIKEVLMVLQGDAKRKYQREWIATRRSEYFADKVCVSCGSTSNLELDHIDRLQKVTHKILSWRESRRLEEIAKCQILCEPCHQAKSSKEMRKLLSYDENGVCKQGHNLSAVGFYRNKKTGKCCSYCHHISRSIKRNGKIKTIEE